MIVIISARLLAPREAVPDMQEKLDLCEIQVREKGIHPTVCSGTSLMMAKWVKTMVGKTLPDAAPTQCV